MARGGKRDGAGRPPKADEEKLVNMMDRILAPESFWSMVARLAATGEVQALRMWASYRYGQPKQSVDVTTDGDKITSVQVEVIRSNGDS